MITEEGMHEFFKAQRDWERRMRYAKRIDPRRRLANMVERDVAQRLVEMGYLVTPTGHNTRYDLLVESCCRVEVKASTWRPALRGTGRYQALIHNRADVIVFCCVNGSLHYFVIPAGELRERQNIAVWSYDPAAYQGQWAPYFQHWDALAEAVEQAKAERTYQLSFLGGL